VSEARLSDSGAGLAPDSDGWFVVNVRDAEWWTSRSFGAATIFERDGGTPFPQFGINISVLQPGQPMCMYHYEVDQEDFLVLSGEAILIVEGEERPLRQWDFVHCPPGTRHVFVGAGAGPCVILAASSRQFQKDGPWGFYCPDETAARYNAASPEETQDTTVAYARFPPSQPARYRDGLLPTICPCAMPWL
jgi:uncharacterized cupin superfamily protein